MYHYVREDSKIFPFSRHKNISEFIKEIDFLKKDYHFYRTSDLLDIKDLNKGYVLTFDDGLKDHLNVAEILKSKNITASFYIPISPYLNESIMPVHKAHLICSKLGGKALDMLYDACNDLGFDYKSIISEEEKSRFSKSYTHQNDDEAIKDFKRLINYYGKLGLREKLLNNIINKLDIPIDPKDFYLTVDEIKYISSLGFEIGSHSVSHTLLSRLKFEEQLYELKNSKMFLENTLKKKVHSFCYPYGGKSSYNNTTIEILKKVGYYNSISVESRDILIYDIKSNIYELPRYDCNEIKKLHPII